MACFYRAWVASAMVCIAMFLQGCEEIMAALEEGASSAFTAMECESKIEEYMLVEKNSTLTLIQANCSKLAAEQAAECEEHGSVLTAVAYKDIKVKSTVTCTSYVLELEKLKNASSTNRSQVPGDVVVWVNANKVEQVKLLQAVSNEIITLAQTPNLDIEDAKTKILEYSGVDSAESQEENLPEADKEVIEDFTMSGGNNIQATSTSHAGRWVASACSLLMMMAFVFRFSRRARLAPSPTESDMMNLVNEGFTEGEC